MTGKLETTYGSRTTRKLNAKTIGRAKTAMCLQIRQARLRNGTAFNVPADAEKHGAGM